MTSIPTSTYARFTNTVWYNQNLNGQINSLLEQQASGKKPGGLAGLGVDSLRSLDAHQLGARSESYLRTLDTLERRSSLYATSLNSIQDAAAEARTQLYQLEDREYATDAMLVEVIDSLLLQVQSALSVRDGERYLFSGAAWNQRPTVDLAAIPIPANIDPLDPIAAPGALPNEPWINGAIGGAEIWDRNAAQVDEAQSMTYGFTALEPAIQTLINGLLTAKHAYSNPVLPDTKEALLDQAYEWINEAIVGTGALEARNGANQQRITGLQESHKASVDFMEVVSAKIEDADLAEVSIQLSLTKAVMEASYNATGRILQMGLVNYLR